MTIAETSAPVAKAAGKGGAFDWINPILVKEVRQALRGKYFRVCFWFTLSAATVVTAVALVAAGQNGRFDADEGRYFLGAAYICLAIAVVGLVPFSAFNSMGAEWEENTYDLLIISNLRPRGILIGKLLATGVQALLFYSAFTPYFVLASLMQGVDLRVVGFLLVATLAFSLVLTVMALSLSTLSRVRFARIMLMAGLAALLVYATAMSIFVSQFLIHSPEMLQNREMPYVVLSASVLHGIAALYAAGMATVMLSHPEENRSSGLRVLTTVCTVGVVLWIREMMGFIPKGGEIAMGIALLIGLFLICLFFVTEPERLPLRVKTQIPSNPILALLIQPWLPGGARGLAFFVLHVAGATLSLAWLRGRYSMVSPFSFADGWLAYLGLVLYAFVYLALPSAVLAPFAAKSNMRSAIRGLILVLIGAFGFLPSLLGFFLGDLSLMSGRHPGNPLFLMERSWNGSSGAEGVWVLMVGLTLLGVLMNFPRVMRALLEVSSASAARRERRAVVEAERHAAA